MSGTLRRRLTKKWMNEGRKSQIVLPDERRLDLLIQPKLYTRELLDLVSSHFKLKEKEYFGINFTDETGHSNWLNLDKKVLEHDFPRKTGILTLNFSVRYYAESISSLRDTATVELFHLNAKQLIFRDQIECDSDTVFELAAYVLQTTYGDFPDEESVRSELKKLPLIPTSALREHPSISYCEDKVIGHYKKLIGISKGLAIVNYMSIVESLPTYGIHYYEVKDKKDIPWWLGLSYKGIAVYDKSDKKEPRKIFTWKLLENLYYRDKKFSIEVHDPKRVSVSRRTFGPGNVAVHAWFGCTSQLTKCIWSMAVAQHQFYLDRKHSKSSLHTVRSSSEIAADLTCSNKSSSSLPGSFSDISRSASSSSLPNLSGSRFDINLDHLDAIKAQREMFEALKARKEALDEKLRKKTEELKLLCMQEGELTGRLPREYPLASGEQPPAIRRRVGTAFSLASKVQDDQAESLSKLELEYELQKQITQAANRLSQDKSVSKYVRKQRRQSFHRAEKKLREMEKKLADGKGGDSTLPLDGKYKSGMARNQSFFLLQMNDNDDPHSQKSTRESPSRQVVHAPMQRSATVRELSPTESRPPLSPTLSSPSLFRDCGGGSQSNNQLYTPLTNRSHSSGSNMSNQSEYENVNNYKDYTGSQDSGFSSANNMYNLTTQQTSHYESSDQLKTPTNKNYSESLENVFEDKAANHNSLDSSYRKTGNPKNYGSLERNSRRKNETWQPRDRQHSDSDASISHLSDIDTSKYGSKRASQSEYDLSGQKSNLIELPVRHEEQGDNRRHHGRWNDVAHTEPSPLIQSPNQDYREGSEPHCYSPRSYEGKRQGGRGSPYIERSIMTKRVESPNSSAVVTVTKMQPHRSVELVSKPFEMSDFYKYSEKIRRQRMIENYQQQLLGDSLSRCSSPSQHSTDSGDGSTGHNSVYKYPHPNYSPSHSSSSSGHSHYPMGPSNHSTPVRTQSPYLTRKGDYDSSSQSASMPKYQSQSTHVQYSVQTASGGRVIKSVHTTTKHTQYQPLTPLKCDPIHNQSRTPSSQNYNPTNRYGNNKVNPIIITEPHFSGDENPRYHGNYHIEDPFNSHENYVCVDPVHEQTHKHTAYVGRSISYENKSVIGDLTDEMLEWCRKHGLKRRKSYV
ncbi:FERM domain-containing protein 4A,FERM domain-containing protein 4B [Mytilus coruscus]|uniref:FERM domain-containing protein 4A,FERM domain-containing protein 4B n=1 Tax=Mytilus coruscus TaxID=42192 RepID=A0A6J8BZL6_MYTCO|nr:FERM domain-containing protein 4A,FERM domain-containing protein 4B [Mytilus coruscus]